MLCDITTKKKLFNATLCARTKIHVHRGVLWGWIGLDLRNTTCVLSASIFQTRHTVAVPLETFPSIEKIYLKQFFLGSFWRWRVTLYAPDLH